MTKAPDRLLGLNPWARQFVRSAHKEEFGRFTPESGSEFVLYQYRFLNGLVVIESIQDTRSNGSRLTDLYLSLVDEQGDWLPESLWRFNAVTAGH